jgi:tRNA pseudouridine38-40 synthase
MRVALKFAYDGRDFFGYARQPKLKTVEGEVIKALVKNNIIETPQTSHLRSAGRTDKGVSSLGNIISFNMNSFEKEVLKELNKENKKILFYAYKKVDDDFYPRYARLRYYRYYINNENLDIEKITKSLSFFIGEHNFSNFARIEPDKNPVRSIDNIVVESFDNYFTVDFFAQNFLWHQIRRIISAVEKVAIGKISDEEITNALNDPKKKIDFGLAPAESLILKDVFYDFEFEYDKKLYNKAMGFEQTIISS